MKKVLFCIAIILVTNFTWAQKDSIVASLQAQDAFYKSLDSSNSLLIPIIDFMKKDIVMVDKINWITKTGTELLKITNKESFEYVKATISSLILSAIEEENPLENKIPAFRDTVIIMQKKSNTLYRRYSKLSFVRSNYGQTRKEREEIELILTRVDENYTANNHKWEENINLIQTFLDLLQERNAKIEELNKLVEYFTSFKEANMYN